MKLKIKFVIVVVFVLISTVTIHAESICGIVYSMTTVEPMGEVTISIPGENIEVKSDDSGNYCLENIESYMADTIVFCYEGYDTMKVEVSELNRRECKSIFLTE